MNLLLEEKNSVNFLYRFTAIMTKRIYLICTNLGCEKISWLIVSKCIAFEFEIASKCVKNFTSRRFSDDFVFQLFVKESELPLLTFLFKCETH